ncbi:MAG: phosphate transport system regulatory protein PhoU [Sphingomonadales bacterium 12-62-5]|nr:MAG: phosphate transport system regulatory protein PhoU [Sphingomonadales bacterium 12-62-5]
MAEFAAHTVKSFDEDIAQLRAVITRMGGLCESQIAESVDALMSRNAEAAQTIIENDKRLDALEAEAEALAVRIIALRAPLADDLREIVAALKIAGVLERIGDYAKNIAKRSAVVAQSQPVAPAVIIPEMARVVFVDRDPVKAVALLQRDQQVDEYYNSLFRALLTFMMENPHYITPSTHLLFVAKNLERIGDHATSVAEMVYYSVTGQRPAERPKNDFTSTVYSPE